MKKTGEMERGREGEGEKKKEREKREVSLFLRALIPS